MVGEYTKYVRNSAWNCFGEKNIRQFETIEELMLELDKTIRDGDLIYMKAANSQHFNRIVKHVKEKYEVKE